VRKRRLNSDLQDVFFTNDKNDQPTGLVANSAGTTGQAQAAPYFTESLMAAQGRPKPGRREIFDCSNLIGNCASHNFLVG
jgi:hypothetical protein